MNKYDHMIIEDGQRMLIALWKPVYLAMVQEGGLTREAFINARIYVGRYVHYSVLDEWQKEAMAFIRQKRLPQIKARMARERKLRKRIRRRKHGRR